METKAPKTFKEWLEILEKDKYFKKSENRLKEKDLSENFSVNDFAIRGIEEINAFHKEFQKYSKITRRGLTFLTDKKGDVSILRKGLPKFFDLSPKFIYKNFSGEKNKKKKKTKTKKNKKKEKKEKIEKNENVENFDHRKFVIYSHEEEKVLLNSFKKKMDIFITQKENGENAQISYCPILDKFALSSKNVTLLALNFSEIDEILYIGKGHVLDIAKYFFSVLEKKNEKEISEIKKVLSEFTFVGEYIGDIKYQHITFEKENLIKFFGVVNKKKILDDYLRIDEAEKIVNSIGFEFVKFNFFKNQNLEQVFEILENLSEDCKFKPIEEIGEGFVIFFEPENPEENFDKRLILKVKGLEYRLQRSIREKSKFIKNAFESKKLNDLQKKNKIHEIEKKAIQKIKSLLIEHGLNENCDYFTKYEEVIEDVKEKIMKNELNPKFFGEYLNCVSKKYKKKNENKKKEEKKIKNEEEKDIKLEKEDENYPIIVVLPMGIPGLGKSYYGKTFLSKTAEKLNFKYISINCDNLREKIISYSIKQDPNLTKNKAYENTRGETAYKYRNLFEENLISCRKKENSEKGVIIYSDKCYNKKAIKEAIIKIKDLLMGKNYKILLAAPKIENSGFLSEINMEEFLLCLYRIKNRENHNMLKYNGFETFEILYGFKRRWENFFSFDLEIDGVLEYYLEKEVEDKNVFKEFEELFLFCKNNDNRKKVKKNKKIKNEIKKLKKNLDNKKDLNLELEKLMKKLIFKENGIDEKKNILEINLEKKIKEIILQKKIPFFKELGILIKINRKFFYDIIKKLKYEKKPLTKKIGNLNDFKKLINYKISFFKYKKNREENYKAFFNFKENEKIDFKISHFVLIEKLIGFFIVKNKTFKNGTQFFIFFTKKDFEFEKIFKEFLEIQNDILEIKGNNEYFLKIDQKMNKVIVFNLGEEIEINGTTKIFC